MRPNASENEQISPTTTIPVARGVDSRPHLASILQEGRKSTNIHAGSGVIWGIPVYLKCLSSEILQMNPEPAGIFALFRRSGKTSGWRGRLRSFRAIRTPPPWTVEETDAFFVVRDHNGQALAYVYFEDEPGRRAAQRPVMHTGSTRNLRRLIRILFSGWAAEEMKILGTILIIILILLLIGATANPMTKDEARKIAAGIAKLPALASAGSWPRR